MSSIEHLNPLLAALQDLQIWMNAAETPYVVIGGIAASLVGRPRSTQDVDVTVFIGPGEWDPLLTIGLQHGFEARLTNPLEFATQSRVLLVRHTSSGISVDVALGALPFEDQMIRRAQWTSVGPVTIPVPTPEDLVIMKAVAHRPRDLEDISAVLDVHPDLDRRRVLRWVRDFSNALERPDLLADVQAALRRHPRRK